MKKRILAILCVYLLAAGCLCSCKDYNANPGVDPATDTVSKDTLVAPEDTSDALAPEEDTLLETFAPGTETERVPSGSDEFIGKTLEDLENSGYEYRGYAAMNSEYVFNYTTRTRSYSVRVNISEEIKNALNEISIFDDDHEKKERAIRAPLVIISITPLNDEPISDDILATYKDQKVSVLIESGFEHTGFTSFNGEYTFYFTKDNQCYSVDLDNAAKELMDKREFGDDTYISHLFGCVVENIEYFQPV